MTDAHILNESSDGLRHTFHISIDADPVDTAVTTRLWEVRRTACIPGFRPGRAPLAMLRNLHEHRIRASVVDRFAIDVARRLIAKRQLEPSRRPIIHIDEDNSASSGFVSFTLLLEVMPHVELDVIDGFSLHQFQTEDTDPALMEFARQHLRQQLFDALVASHDFPVPQDMAENEYERIVRGFEAQVGAGVDDKLTSELKNIAERRVRLAILISEIGRVYEIGVPRSEVEALVEQEAETDPEHQSEIIDYYLDHPTALAELQSPLFEERVVEFLLSRSRVQTVKLSGDELRRKMEELQG